MEKLDLSCLDLGENRLGLITALGVVAGKLLNFRQAFESNQRLNE
jgi:hypothetical protein